MKRHAEKIPELDKGTIIDCRMSCELDKKATRQGCHPTSPFRAASPGVSTTLLSNQTNIPFFTGQSIPVSRFHYPLPANIRFSILIKTHPGEQNQVSNTHRIAFSRNRTCGALIQKNSLPYGF
jgi:hypothetical protein